jgi:HK97 gp10 family phage protein
MAKDDKTVSIDWDEDAFKKSYVLAMSRKERTLSGITAAVANLLEQRAKQLAPVGETGDLRAGLHATWDKKGDDYYAYLHSAVDYWVFPEFGTVGTSPHPFARPSMKAAKEKIRNELS